MKQGNQRLGKLTRKFIGKWAETLEDIHRQNGYGAILWPLFILLLTIFGLAATFNLETVVFVAACILILFLVLLQIFMSRSIVRHQRHEHEIADQFQKYAESIETSGNEHSLVYLRQVENVKVSSKGDVAWNRKIILGATSERIPHHLASGFVGGGHSTNRHRSRVRCEATRKSKDALGRGVKVLSTVSWGRGKDGSWMLTVHVFLGETVQEGEVVSIRVYWPRMCAEFRSGEKSEEFFMSYTNRAYPTSYILFLKDCPTTPNVDPFRGTDYLLKAKQKGQVIAFADVDPKVGERLGVTVHLGNNKRLGLGS